MGEYFEAGPDECETGIALTKAIEAVLAEDDEVTAAVTDEPLLRCTHGAPLSVTCIQCEKQNRAEPELHDDDT